VVDTFRLANDAGMPLISITFRRRTRNDGSLTVMNGLRETSRSADRIVLTMPEFCVYGRSAEL
jgi:hypothetical protein